MAFRDGWEIRRESTKSTLLVREQKLPQPQTQEDTTMVNQDSDSDITTSSELEEDTYTFSDDD